MQGKRCGLAESGRSNHPDSAHQGRDPQLANHRVPRQSAPVAAAHSPGEGVGPRLLHVPGQHGNYEEAKIKIHTGSPHG
ncbi:Protein of unknown function, partial [Gryllus bimaculatus]